MMMMAMMDSNNLMVIIKELMRRIQLSHRSA